MAGVCHNVGTAPTEVPHFYHLPWRQAGSIIIRTMEPIQSRPHRRLAREQRTMRAMILMYCQGHHGAAEELCPDCSTLHTYARARLDRCPYAGQKPACANCPIHCYKPDMREKVRQIMRYAGPRMLTRHPLLAILHLLDGLRKPPPR